MSAKTVQEVIAEAIVKCAGSDEYSSMASAEDFLRYFAENGVVAIEKDRWERVRDCAAEWGSGLQPGDLEPIRSHAAESDAQEGA